ncbi:hypothetical protein QBL19_15320 [Lactiplantibacillus plantarum]|nr:hypothetical protein [Lactiplantibacillus plantarum]MDG6770159.1 hypothetical protein [Lactiplantibacillus plantarum]
MDYEEALKNRQEVLCLVNDGKIQEAFSLLTEGSYTCPNDNSQHSAAIKTLQEQIIESLIRQASDQNYREIFIILNRLISFFGLSQRLCIEIGLINISRQIDLDFQIQFLKSLPPEILNDPIIQLIHAETLRLINNPAAACTIYNSLPPRESWWPFEPLWESLTQGIAKYLLEINTKFLHRQAGNSTGWHIEPHALNALIAGLIRSNSGNANDFRHQIEKVMWHTPVPHTDVGGLTVAFLAAHITNLDADKAAIVFHLVVSFEKQHEIDLILQKEEFIVTKLAYHPLFIKYFDIFSQKKLSYRDRFNDMLDIFLKSSFCKNFIDGDMQAFNFSILFNTNVWATEILSRYRKRLPPQGIRGIPFLAQPRHTIFPKAGGENHLFIGIFGQMRDPHGSFSKVLEYIYKDTQDWRDKGKTVSIGISTWDQTGQKKIEDGSPTSEFAHRVPEPLKRILTEHHIHTLAELRNFLPFTAEAIQKASYSNETVSMELLHEIAKNCGFDNSDIFINISTENQYMDDIGREFRAFYKNAGSGVENQARMWHRIASLYDLARQATEQKSAAIGTIALMRPDVLFENSSISNLAEITASETSAPTAICDFDPQACWIEGVGDRYFAGSAQAVARVFDAKDLILQIIRDPSLSELYHDRPFWHRFAQTIFYESDVFLQSSTAIHMRFLRQNIDLDILKPALKADYEQTTNENIKKLIQNYM